jgi:hypothetical protein
MLITTTIRHYRGAVKMTSGGFVVGLLAALPEASLVVRQHLDDHDGSLLLHLLVADLRRLLLDAWARGDEALGQRGLAFLDSALAAGDDRVSNAVAVSFVEDIGWWETEMQPFLTTWPGGLLAEVERQRAARG